MILQELQELFGVFCKPKQSEAAVYPGNAHVAMEVSKQCLRTPFLERWMTRWSNFSRLFALQFHAVEAQHHLVGTDIPIVHFWVCEKDIDVPRENSIGLAIEPRLEEIGE